MAPLPVSDSKKTSTEEAGTIGSTSMKRSPSKKSRVDMEMEDEELDYGDDHEEQSKATETEVRTRKKPPVTYRLGDILQMAQIDTESYSRRQERLSRPASSLSAGSSSEPADKKLASPISYNYERETDPLVIARRKKQVDYGKRTQDYHEFAKAVPRLVFVFSLNH